MKYITCTLETDSQRGPNRHSGRAAEILQPRPQSSWMQQHLHSGLFSYILGHRALGRLQYLRSTPMVANYRQTSKTDQTRFATMAHGAFQRYTLQPIVGLRIFNSRNLVVQDQRTIYPRVYGAGSSMSVAVPHTAVANRSRLSIGRYKHVYKQPQQCQTLPGVLTVSLLYSAEPGRVLLNFFTFLPEIMDIS